MAKKKFYVLIVTGGTEIDYKGPYKTELGRDAEASHLWNDELRQEYDQVFMLDIDGRGRPKVSSYCDGDLENFV